MVGESAPAATISAQLPKGSGNPLNDTRLAASDSQTQNPPLRHQSTLSPFLTRKTSTDSLDRSPDRSDDDEADSSAPQHMLGASLTIADQVQARMGSMVDLELPPLDESLWQELPSKVCSESRLRHLGALINQVLLTSSHSSHLRSLHHTHHTCAHVSTCRRSTANKHTGLLATHLLQRLPRTRRYLAHLAMPDAQTTFYSVRTHVCPIPYA